MWHLCKYVLLSFTLYQTAGLSRLLWVRFVMTHCYVATRSFTAKPLEFPTPNQNLTISTEFLSARQKVHHLWLLGTPEMHFPFAEPYSKMEVREASHNGCRFGPGDPEPAAFPIRLATCSIRVMLNQGNVPAKIPTYPVLSNEGA